MDEYFVRIYHMKDGSTAVPNAVYALEEQAAAALDKFNPNGKDGVTPEDDMKNVSYVTIEKRYAPKGSYWSTEEARAQSDARAKQLLIYLGHLTELQNGGRLVGKEITAVTVALNEELGVETDKVIKLSERKVQDIALRLTLDTTATEDAIKRLGREMEKFAKDYITKIGM